MTVAVQSDDLGIKIYWRAVDLQSGIDQYHIGLGTTPTDADIVPMEASSMDTAQYIKVPSPLKVADLSQWPPSPVRDH